MTISKIIHHAATVNMGEVTQEWADDYRAAAWVAINNQYPNAEIRVADGEFNDVIISDDCNEEEINNAREFLCELWEKYGC